MKQSTLLKTTAFLAVTIFSVSGAMASGFVIKMKCSPLASEAPVIEFLTTQTGAQGPITKQSSVTVGESQSFKLLKNGEFSKGLKITSVPLQTPSGNVSASLFFISIEPGQSGVEPQFEVLYQCISSK
jgi:hypothetical protein